MPQQPHAGPEATAGRSVGRGLSGLGELRGAAGCGRLNPTRALRLPCAMVQEIEVLNAWQLLTAKPAVYLVNMSPKDYCRCVRGV